MTNKRAPKTQQQSTAFVCGPHALTLPAFASLPPSALSSSASCSLTRMPPPTRLDEASANARQWCTICQTNSLMSVYEPIAISALKICGAAGSSTDKKLLKLALYAVDETALLLNRSPVPQEFLALLEAYERILDSIRRHIENAQISTNKRGNLFSRNRTSSRLKNGLKSQLKTMCLTEGPSSPAIPTRADNAVEILSASLRASTIICEAPPLNFLKPIIGIAALICETVKTVKSNREAAEELAKHAINVTNCVVQRASKHEIFSDTNEDALNILKGALEDVHSYLMFLNKPQEKDGVVQLNAGLDRALSLFTTTCVLSSNECVRSNTIQLDVLASTVKQLDGEMSQNFAALHLQLKRTAGSEKATWAVSSSPNGPHTAAIMDRVIRQRQEALLFASKEQDDAYTRLEGESTGPDGKEALERFVEARTALVAEAERLAEDCDSWSQDLSRRYLDDGRTQGARVLKSASSPPATRPQTSPRARTAFMDSPYLDKIPRLTSKRYNKALPHLLPILHAAHSARLSRRRATLQKTVLTASQATRRLVRGRTGRRGTRFRRGRRCARWWTTSWRGRRRRSSWGGGADAAVDAGEAGAQGERHIAAAVAQHVPGLVEAWRTERKRQFVGLLPRAGELKDADPARGSACGDADGDADVSGAKGADARAAGADDVLRLDLAMSVFTCLGSWVPGRCLIGFKGRIGCTTSRKARAQRRLSGRNPASTSAAEMDKVDARYVCGGCAVQARGGVRGRKALTWREGVLHAVEVARGAEPGHAEGAGHAIPRPVQDSHFMFFPGAECTPRVAALLSEEGLVAEYRHGCNVVREADWTRVERIAGSSAVEPVSRSSAVEPTPTPLDALPDSMLAAEMCYWTCTGSTISDGRVLLQDLKSLLLSSNPAPQAIRTRTISARQNRDSTGQLSRTGDSFRVRAPWPGTARLGVPPSLRLVVVLILLSCPNAFTIPPRRSHGQRTPVVHYLPDQPSDERLSAHRGLSTGNMRRSGLVDKTTLWLNRSPVGPILDNIRRHIENAQISTNKRGNLFSRHMSSSRLKNELKNQLKTMRHRGQVALPTRRENAVEILSVSLRASTLICEAPPLSFLKPIIGIAALICETAKTVKSNRDAADELAKHATNVTNSVVERASKNGVVQGTNEEALNILRDVHSHLIFLSKRRLAMSWMLAAQEKDLFAQLNAGLDRALSLFATTCVLSSNEHVRSNTIQLDNVASTLKQLDGEMSQKFAALRLQLTRSADSEKTAAVTPTAKVLQI
ncbi:hypothetical protein C8J57DRAFT_1668488 [Mycena rebaudengoi]|nr:hypothetical protein C8J57DRAFT_1668488 [Mycena rebaudengoi]